MRDCITHLQCFFWMPPCRKGGTGSCGGVWTSSHGSECMLHMDIRSNPIFGKYPLLTLDPFAKIQWTSLFQPFFIPAGLCWLMATWRPNLESEKSKLIQNRENPHSKSI